MLTPEQLVELAIEKPAAGGRMIARHEGQVVFVLGAIPGEVVAARVDRVERQLAFATAIEVRTASPDRREPFADPLCGGCVYSHVAYPGQLRLKAALIQDAFARLGRIRLPPFEVLPSPERGYRLRGRLQVQGERAGFYREGTHTVCDAGPTGQLTPAAIAAAIGAIGMIQASGARVGSVTTTENLSADERALHVVLQPGPAVERSLLDQVVATLGLTGLSADDGRMTLVAGDCRVSDPLAALTSGRAGSGVLRRRPASFFQANRFLLPQLVAAVLDAVPADGRLLELYAGVGLFSVGLAAAGRGGITAVEGDSESGRDLRENAAAYEGSLRVRLGSVEGYLERPHGPADTVIVDPPRSGISKPAMQSVAKLGAARVIYVSCDPPTMARDARRLIDAGYELQSFRAFDLFPNTPHVESVGVFVRG